MLFMAGPLVLLYVLSIGLVRLVEKRRQSSSGGDELLPPPYDELIGDSEGDEQ